MSEDPWSRGCRGGIAFRTPPPETHREQREEDPRPSSRRCAGYPSAFPPPAPGFHVGASAAMRADDAGGDHQAPHDAQGRLRPADAQTPQPAAVTSKCRHAQQHPYPGLVGARSRTAPLTVREAPAVARPLHRYEDVHGTRAATTRYRRRASPAVRPGVRPLSQASWLCGGPVCGADLMGLLILRERGRTTDRARRTSKPWPCIGRATPPLPASVSLAQAVAWAQDDRAHRFPVRSSRAVARGLPPVVREAERRRQDPRRAGVKRSPASPGPTSVPPDTSVPPGSSVKVTVIDASCTRRLVGWALLSGSVADPGHRSTRRRPRAFAVGGKSDVGGRDERERRPPRPAKARFATSFPVFLRSTDTPPASPRAGRGVERERGAAPAAETADRASGLVRQREGQRPPRWTASGS